MKRPILIGASLLIVALICTFIVAIILSFKVVRQTTDKINLGLKSKMQQLVRIPEVIPPQTKSFDKTIYVWEMETNQGEITKVKFTHDTIFNKNTQDFTATLEMEAGQDPSLFNKVLPAVVSDKQAIVSIVEPTRINLEKNEQIGYENIKLFEVEGRSGQTSKVTWTFTKDRIVSENEGLYQKLYSYPPIILKNLYSLQRFIITIFSS